MTQMTQEEIVTNTKTVLQGLEALRVEHMSIIAGLTEGKKDPDKADIIQKNIENIELGLGEAQVSHCFYTKINNNNNMMKNFVFSSLGYCCFGFTFAKH